MARPVRPWFRFYVEAFSDRKLRRIKPEYRWLFAACLGAARQSPRPGILLVSEGVPMDANDLADYAGMDVRTVKAGMRQLEDLGLITKGSPGDLEEIAWRSPTFQTRQYESDDVTKRTRKHRATRENAAEGTFLRRSQERSGNGDGNTPETETETETETEKQPCASANAEREFDEWYAEYPRKKGKGQAMKAYRAARKKTDAQTLLRAIRQQAPALMARGIEFAPYPATWLNGERWDDLPDNIATLPTRPVELDEYGAEINPDLPPLPKGIFE